MERSHSATLRDLSADSSFYRTHERGFHNPAAVCGRASLAPRRRCAVEGSPVRRESLHGESSSSRSRPVLQGDRSLAELSAVHEIDLDAFAQTREQSDEMPGEDRLHDQLVLVDESPWVC